MMKRIFFLFVALLLAFPGLVFCQEPVPEMTFYDLQFGMSVDEVKAVVEKYTHSFTRHNSEKRILYCNSSRLHWGEKNPLWDYAFIDGKLVFIQFEMRQDPYVVMKKLEDTYGGHAQLQYTLRDMKKRRTEKHVWQGKLDALQEEMETKKQVPHLRIRSTDFVAATDSYDIMYHMRGKGFSFPGVIAYSVKGFYEQKEQIEREYKMQQKARRQQALKKQYDELKL